MLLGLLVSASAVAQPGPRLTDPLTDGLVVGGAAAGWGGLWLAQPLTRTSCPCERRDAPAFDRFAVDADLAPAEAVADAVVVATLAGAALTIAFGAPDEAALVDDAVLVTEAVVVTGLLTQVAKTAVARPYPYMRRDDLDPALEDDGVNYQSMWSGHTAVPMAAAVSTAWLFARRHPRSPLRWVLWSVGPALALAAGSLQVSAANHYPSDVLAGAAVGAGTGWLVPWLHAD